MKLLVVEGARAPVPHSWRRHWLAQRCTMWGRPAGRVGSGRAWLGQDFRKLRRVGSRRKF